MAELVEISVEQAGPFHRVLCSRHGYVSTAGSAFAAALEVLGHAAVAHRRVGAAPVGGGP